MITRLRIQNYKSISDLTLDLGSKNLLMGQNGSGKTAVFDALAAIRELVVEGEKCERVFPIWSAPAWIQPSDAPVQQTFELSILVENDLYTYVLEIGQNRIMGFSRIISERFLSNDRVLFASRDGEVTIFQEVGGAPDKYPVYPERSAIPTHPMVMQLVPQIANFSFCLKNVHLIRIDAPRMSGRSERDESMPARDLSNFASWYRQAFMRDTSAGVAYLGAVKEVIGGIEGLNAREVGQGIVVLEVALKMDGVFHVENGPRASSKYALGFIQLSDGQRALLALYALAYFLVRENSTLCIDEPDNFIALAELQPWLHTLIDLVDDNGGQVILASHHPEMYNLLAPEHGIVLSRDGAGPTQASRYQTDEDSPLSPAERVAMGEENG